jgi:hypothetical protein
MSSDGDENFMDESSYEEEAPRRNAPRSNARKLLKTSIDGYGDDLMGDDEDRENLAKMTELEREKILMERQNKRDELKRRKEALEKLDRKRGQERFGNKVKLFFYLLSPYPLDLIRFLPD